jgi:uncharacterized protein HemY
MKSELFRERAAKDPNNRLFRFSLGQALVDEHAYADAIEHLLFCTQSQSDWMMPRILAGKAYLELGKPAEAKPILQEALQLAIEQHHEDPAEELRQILADL